MKEADELIVGPWPGLVTQESEAGGCQPFHFRMNIGYLESDVVHPFPLFFYEACDDAVGVLALQQLDLCLSFFKESGGHLLCVHFFGLVAWGVEQRLEQGDGYGEVPDGNTDVFDFLHAQFFSKVRGSFFKSVEELFFIPEDQRIPGMQPDLESSLVVIVLNDEGVPG